MALLYIGAGTDLDPLDIFDENKMFVFVDSLPRTEYGFLESLNLTQLRKTFIKTLTEKLKLKGFRKTGHLKKIYKMEKPTRLKYHSPGVLIFSDGDRTLYYFYSCPYPDQRNNLLSEMTALCDKLYVAGHEPESNVILKMKKPIQFIGSLDTCYRVGQEQDYLFYQLCNWMGVNELVSVFYTYDPVTKTLKNECPLQLNE